jgi:prevent-host-death family protein
MEEQVAAVKSPARVRRVAAREAREVLADLLNEVAFGGSRIVIQRHGRDVAALVSIADLERLRGRVSEES